MPTAVPAGQLVVRPWFRFGFRRLAGAGGRRGAAGRLGGLLPSRAVGGRGSALLLGGLLLSHLPAQAQVNRFVTYDDANQVPGNMAKSGNVIPNDDNPDNLPNAAFAVTLLSPPANGTLTSFNADGSYVYTPNPGFLGADSFTYQICQPGATPACSNASTVRLNVYDGALVCTLGTGPNLLKNPSFALGNQDFTTSYGFVSAPSGSMAGGLFAIDSNAKPYYGLWNGTGRTGAGDKFMIVDGAPALVAVYSQTVTVLPNRYYSFSVYAANIHPLDPTHSLPLLALVVDGKSTSVVTELPAPTGQYVQIQDLYFSGPGPAGGFPVKVEVRDVNKDPQGNDFGLDDLYFGSCRALLLADPKTTAPVTTVAAPAPIIPLSATLNTVGSVGVTVTSFTVQSLPATGTLYYNGQPVAVGQVIPVAGPGSASSGGALAYLPAGTCTAARPSFTYSATDSDGNESTNLAPYVIPVEPLPTPAVRVRGPVPVCAGGQARFSADSRPGFRYTWYNGATVVNGAGAVPNDSVLVATATGTYTVQVELGGCAATSPPVVLTVLPPLTAGRVGPAQTLCASARPAPLTGLADPTGGTGQYTYQWESSADNATWMAIAGATGVDYAPGPAGATTYLRRRATTGGSCGAAYANPVALTVLPPLAAGAAGANQTLCAGTAATSLASTAAATGGTGAFAYQWESSTDSTTWTAIAGATAADYAPGVLTATTGFRRRATSGTGSCGQALTAPVTVQVQPVLTTSVTLSPPPAQCPGTVLTFTATPRNAGAAPSFRWRVNGAPVAATGPIFSSGDLNDGDQVQVEVTPAAGGCRTGPATATAAVTRTAAALPTVSIQVEPAGPVCPGTALRFSVAQATAPGAAPQYQWQVDGADVAGAEAASFSPSNLRDGQTVALVLRTSTACAAAVATRSNELRVVVVDAQVDAGPDREITEGDTVVLRGTATSAYRATWTPDGSLRPGPDGPLRPIAAPTETTTYTLAAGLDGCRATDEVTVRVVPYVRIPNAFTPNGDGQDDTWQIERIDRFPRNSVGIFNRWGNRIFETTGYGRSNEWRGLINGQPAPVGTYYYVVKLGNGKSYAGPLTVLY